MVRAVSMRVSKKSEYALRALFAIGRAPQAKLHQIHELSREENIPVKFLEQILLNLKNAAILKSKRGVGGGYSLTKGLDQISIGEVIRLMDGPLAPIPCAMPVPSEPCSCPNPQTCPLRQVMLEVRESLGHLLDERTLADAMQAVSPAGGLHFEI